jgi:hypothetical protein
MMTGKVFRYLLNEAAFVDTIALSVWTEENTILDQLLDARNIGILSRNSFYARRLSGRAPLTGNPVDVLYGKVSRFPRVPPCRVVLRSEEVPLTGAQVNETMRLLFPNATRIQPVLVELTFDLKRVSVPKLQQQIVHRARQWQELQDVGRRKTLYIGSPASSWQLRIYDKTKRVVRLELILQQKFLSDLGIRQPDAIVRLRSLQLRQYFSLRRFSPSRIAAATKGWRDEYWQDMAREWESDGRPLQMLCRMLGGKGDTTGRLFPRSGLQRTVEKMQKNRVW